MDYLIVASGPRKGRVFALPQDAQAAQAIGRLCGDVPLADSQVSREHAQLTASPDGWWLTDLGSTNGTLVNGRTIDQPVLLRRGDRIKIGRVMLVYRQRRNGDGSAPHGGANASSTSSSAAMIVQRDALGRDAAADPNSHAVALRSSSLLPRQEFLGYAVAQVPPSWRPAKRWIVAAATFLLLLTGAHFYLLIQSHAQNRELSRVAAIVAAAPALNQDLLLQQIQDTIRQQRDPQIRATMQQILAELRAQPTSDPELQATLGRVASALAAQPESNKRTDQLLQDVLAAVRATGQVDEPTQEKLDQILAAIRIGPHQTQTELLSEILTSVQNESDARQDAVLDEILAAVQSKRVEQIEASLREIRQAVQTDAAETDAAAQGNARVQLMLQKILAEIKTSVALASAGNATRSDALPHEEASGPSASQGSFVASGLRASQSAAALSIDRTGTSTARPMGGTVFVIDVSGSLGEQWAVVAQEVHRVVHSADCPPPYSLLLARRQRVMELPQLDMTGAPTDWFGQALSWIEDDERDEPDAATSASMGLVRAVPAIQAFEPRVVWLLSDCIYPTTTSDDAAGQLIASLDQLNARRNIRLHTLQFFYDDPSRTLKRIATAHGGSYTFVIRNVPEKSAQLDR